VSKYEVQLSKAASKQLKKLPVQAREKIQVKIDELADNPRPPGVVKLEDSDNGYRIRVGTSASFVRYF
jgi:mRNA interferase RelE/StbE